MFKKASLLIVGAGVARILTDVIAEQPLKALFPIPVTLSGMTNEPVKFSHW